MSKKDAWFSFSYIIPEFSPAPLFRRQVQKIILNLERWPQLVTHSPQRIDAIIVEAGKDGESDGRGDGGLEALEAG